MADVAIIARPATEGTRHALVLTEDRLGHYPEFRAFIVRTFDLDRVGLSEPGFVPRAIRNGLCAGVRRAERPTRSRRGWRSTRSSRRWNRSTMRW